MKKISQRSIKIFIVLFLVVLAISGFRTQAVEVDEAQSTTMCRAMPMPVMEEVHVHPQVTAVIEEDDEEITAEKPERHMIRVPLYNQRDYKEPYGNYGTIASHGCGITALAMVASYLNDEIILPTELAEKYGHYNTAHGSYHSLFPETSEELGLGTVIKTYDWKEVIEALKNDHLIISLQSEDIFTNGGHFIVLTGITEEGKILVNDPNGDNWERFPNEFLDGFTEEQIRAGGSPWYIYETKEQLKDQKNHLTESE